MAMPGDTFQSQLVKAPESLGKMIEALKNGNIPEAIERFNSLKDLCGMTLTGTPEGDEKAWKEDRSGLGFDEFDNLCRWWLIGELTSDAQAT